MRILLCGWVKPAKNATIPIDRAETRAVDHDRLPPDAEFQGYAAVIVHDVTVHFCMVERGYAAFNHIKSVGLTQLAFSCLAVGKKGAWLITFCQQSWQKVMSHHLYFSLLRKS